jgi:hypothetical protein
MYTYLVNQHAPRPYPWDAMSLDMEGYPTGDYLDGVILALDSVQATFGDPKPIIIGEWGATIADFDQARPAARHSGMRA